MIIFLKRYYSFGVIFLLIKDHYLFIIFSEGENKISTFGQRFKELRLSKKYTQTKIGEELGLKIRMIQYYEKNERFPSFQGIIDIAEFFDVSLDYLVGRTDDPKRY